MIERLNHRRWFVFIAVTLACNCNAFLDGCAQDGLLQLEEQAVIRAVKAVSSSVVRIDTIGGLEIVNNSQVNQGPTTGMIVSNDGYVISSMINFVQDPASIIVRFENGERSPAKIVARDHSRQLVLLKCNVIQPSVPILLAPRSSLQVGQTTIAIGRIYETEKPNVSVGILSAKNRIWDRAVQTDAKVSPANFGGPLIDLTGRVIGILAPLSSDNDDVAAGTQWYDSGIGFAVPLDDVLAKIETLKDGIDLHRGLIGIAFKDSNIYADGAEIGVCPDGAPAAKTGIQPGDFVVQLDDQPVRSQAEFKHAIGRAYAGETVNVVIERDGGKATFEIELVDRIAPYAKASIGILVSSREPEMGVAVRFVIPDSPAETAGIRRGDTIFELNGTRISDRASLAQSMAQLSIDEEIELKLVRSNANQEPVTVRVRTIAQTCQPLDGVGQAARADEVTTIDLLVPEFMNKCFVVMPQDSKQAPAVLVWVPNPGSVDKNEFVKAWSSHCLEYNVAMLVPQSADDTKWDPLEAEFIEKSLTLLRNQIEFDSRRVAIGGAESGGAMAAISCFNNRESYCGLFVLDTKLPARLANSKTSAILPLSVFIATSSRFRSQLELEASVSFLKKAKFPVYVETEGAKDAIDWAPTLLRWVDSLDRF